MYIVHIVVEGNTDKVLLERLLANLQHVDIRFHIAGNKRAAHSLARTLQVQFREPVALIIDADTHDLDTINEEQSMYEAYLGLTSYGIPFIVILMVPSIKAILFQQPRILETLLGKALEPDDQIRSKYVPKTVLENYLRDARMKFSDLVFRMDEEQIQTLRNISSIAKLEEFVQRVVERRVVV